MTSEFNLSNRLYHADFIGEDILVCAMDDICEAVRLLKEEIHMQGNCNCYQIDEIFGSKLI